MKAAATKSQNATRAFPAAGIVLALLSFLVFIVHTVHTTYLGKAPAPSLSASNAHDNNKHDRMHRLLPSVAIASSNADTNSHHHGGDDNDPGAYDYLIIQYHKTGHEIAYRLATLVKDDAAIPAFDRVRHDPLPKRDHDPTTNCPRVELRRGMLNVQAAPDFFCDVRVLAEELLRGTTTTTGGGGGRTTPRTKSGGIGIKIVHLVRDPFRLAVSNYKYHARRPTPEKWVKGLDVCAVEEDPMNYPELLMPALGGHGVMVYSDFDDVLDACRSIFRTRAGLEHADYYAHLMGLDPLEGLFLATTQLLRGRLGDLTRMANNIIKLQQLQQLEMQFNLAQHHLLPQKRIQVLTLATEDFIQWPGKTAMRFLDFLLGDDASSADVKERIAAQYERDYLELKEAGSSPHVTDWGSDTAILEASLREHELFGRVLGNIQRVVENALQGRTGRHP